MNTVMILAKDIITDIIEGDCELMAWLREKALEHELVVLKSCVVEGLERADPATPPGLRALAALIAMSRFQTAPTDERPTVDKTAGRTIRLTADVLLSCLLGRVGSSIIQRMTDDFPVIINDALLVAAGLSVRDEDELHPANLAAALRITTMHLVDVPDADRTCWPENFSDEAISRLRTKALVQPDGRQ